MLERFPAWRISLSAALHHNRSQPQSRYVQLATVRKNGQPANRTLVFRGFLEHRDQLQFITDQRSAKVEQIAEHSWGEICWYFAKTREQFRILGKLSLISAEEDNSELQTVRHTLWQNLSDKARSQFTWPHPAKSRESESERFDTNLSADIPPSSYFCLLLLTPSEVDHLTLRGNPQNRWKYWQNQDLIWQSQAVNP